MQVSGTVVAAEYLLFIHNYRRFPICKKRTEVGRGCNAIFFNVGRIRNTNTTALCAELLRNYYYYLNHITRHGVAP